MDATGSDEAHVVVQPDGPYLVRRVPIVRRRPVVSEHGEPITWQTTERFASHPSVALCRCGSSARKPFCDGSHARVGFDGTEAAAGAPYEERSSTYVATRVIVEDDRSICVHAGFCGNRVTNVWDLVTGDATEDSIARAQLISMVERCPSGALTYRLDERAEPNEPELPLEIAVTANGPLALTGGVVVERADGSRLEVRNRTTLCRCGASANKPLCDGSHAGAGFTDPA